MKPSSSRGLDSERGSAVGARDAPAPGGDLYPPPARADETFLFELWDDVWKKRWWIVGVSMAASILAAITVVLMPSWYRADVLLAPAEKRSTVGLAGALGGLANLAGISVGGGDSAEAIAVLRSRDLTRDFIVEQSLMPVLFAKDWDATTGSWKQMDADEKPDLRDGVRYFDRKIRAVSEDRRTKLVRLSIEWKDPKVAAQWANLLVDELNERMRMRALKEAEENVKYLRAELSVTTQVALQQSIGRLLETEMQKLMLARGNKDFAFRIVDRAEIPKRRSRPQRALLVVGAAVLTGIIAVMFVMLREIRGRRALERRT